MDTKPGVADRRILDIGVVVAGAGARGAYEAGLLGHLIPEVAARTQAEGRLPRFSFIGTSAGSLNAALIASRAPRVTASSTPAEVHRSWSRALLEVAQVWRAVTEDRVLGRCPHGRIVGVIARTVPLVRSPLVSLLDVGPLTALAHDDEVVDWEGLRDRVVDGRVAAIGAAATARDGRTVVFLHRHDTSVTLARDERRDIDYVDVPDGLSAQHMLASSAIPAVFPAQRVTSPEDWSGWYYDGGVRLNTPLKPALALHLDHLLVVGTHPDRYDRATRAVLTASPPEIDEAMLPIANQLMADQIVQDLHTLRRRNTLPGSRPIHHLFAGPPDAATLAELSRTAATQPGAMRLLRQLLVGQARWELSSYVLFDPGYLSAAVDAGGRRAARILPAAPTVPWQT